MTLDQMRAAFDAFEQDGVIAFRRKGNPNRPALEARRPAWNFEDFDYFPMPKPFECWVNLYLDRLGAEYCGDCFDTEGETVDERSGLPNYLRTVRLREVAE